LGLSGSMRANIILFPHFGQAGRSMICDDNVAKRN
jgi:hypothetical protein